MSAPIIQGDYEQLEAIAARFQSQAAMTSEMESLLKRNVGALEDGGWQGRGATAFFAEMNSEMFPAVLRLNTALGEAQAITLKIAQVLRQAEAEAASLFQGEAAANGGNGGGPGGGYGPGGGNGSDPGGYGPGGGSGGPVGPGSTYGPTFTGRGNIWQYDPQKGGKPAPSIGVRYGVGGAVWGDPKADGFSFVGGEGGLQAGVGEKGLTVGAYGEYYTAQGRVDGVWGDDNLALTGGVTAKALSADGFIGIKDNSFGASIGGSLVSVRGEAGTNVAGVNVGVTGEVGLKAELGFKIGQETEIKLPFVTIGFSFGGSKKDN